jgi:hypothetical protein
MIALQKSPIQDIARMHGHLAAMALNCSIARFRQFEKHGCGGKTY